jgi:ABC-type Fe3+/spermidine/putrescine transport system ATPase subunit
MIGRFSEFGHPITHSPNHSIMLELVSITKSFGQTRALDDVTLTVNAGEVVSLLGPSGCGKSTLLAIVAGLETPDRGEARWDGENLAGVPAHRRRFGLMFQDYALFPHRDVFDNIAFGLRMQNSPQDEIARQVRDALALVNLSGFERRDVNTLSGGEAQRVALARALAPRPRLLMLDEPLGALDRALRDQLLDDLGTLLRHPPSPSGREAGGEGELTVIYVTHDQQEAFALADRVAVMNAGRIVQVGAPEEVYARPASRFVAEFLGLKNIVRGRVERRGAAVVVATEVGEITVQKPGFWEKPGFYKQGVEVLLRPDGATIAEDGASHIEGRMLDKSFRGSRTVARVLAGAVTLTFEFPASQPLPAAGEAVRLRVNPEAVYFLA